jgi:hypothetical protein
MSRRGLAGVQVTGVQVKYPDSTHSFGYPADIYAIGGLTPRIERQGPYTYLVVGPDRFLLTADDIERLRVGLSAGS